MYTHVYMYIIYMYMYIADVLTVFHEVAELFVLDPAVRSAVVVHHSLNLIPGEVDHTTTTHHQTTNEL